MLRMNRMFTILLLVALILSACQPIQAPTAKEQADKAVMNVMGQFFDAYRTYDMDKMLSLQTDDAVWTWIDPAKNFPAFGAEGKWVGTGKDEIRAMFEMDRGQAGYSGYILWSEIHGNTVTATELWESDITMRSMCR